MKRKAKKVLIITTLAPPAFGGTPTMLGRYFSYFPKDSYCFLADSITKQIPSISNLLPCRYYFFNGGVFDGTRKNTFPRKKRITPKKKTNRQGLLLNIFNYLKSAPFDLIRLIRTVSSAYTTGLKVIEKEKPEHILAVSDNGPSFIVSYLLSRKTKVPYSLFFFDIYKKNFLPPFRLLTAFILEKKIVKKAVNIFTAGEGISNYYRKLYSRKCITIPNSCKISSKTLKAGKIKEPIRIVYTGAYYWAQSESIERFRDIIKDLSWAKFSVYSHDTSDLEDRGVSQLESLRIQKKADVLLLPLSFDPTIFREVIKTAPTGKLPEYLASGVPILVYAPSYAWISSYIKKNKAGVVVTNQDKESIKKALMTLKDNHLRKTLVKNALLLAKKNHGLKKNSQILYNILLRSNNGSSRHYQ